jgi:hypothetical protein
MSERGEMELCRRREPRQPIDVDIVAFRRDGSRSVVALSDISYEGCQMNGRSDFVPAEPVRLVVPFRGHIGARVCWASSDRAGARFERGGSDAVMLPDGGALRFSCPLNYGSGRVFGKKGLPSD